MRILNTATNGNVYAGTFGGVMLSFFSNVFVEDLLKTVVLAAVGAVVSFLVSLALKNFIRSKNH